MKYFQIIFNFKFLHIIHIIKGKRSKSIIKRNLDSAIKGTLRQHLKRVSSAKRN